MVIVNSKDFVEVKLMSLIADYDRETLINLYQPFLGYSAVSVYFTLWCEADNQKITSLTTHGQITRKMGITTGDFIESRKRLEAVGLLKTHVSIQDDELKYYIYEIYAPKTPKAFFDDALLFGLLIKFLGETEANKLKTLYHFDNSDELGKDISASFVEVFSPNFDDPAFIKALEGNPSLGRNSGNIVSEFSYESFFNQLKQISQIREDAFSKKEMKEIERLATLNGVNEIVAANTVNQIFDASAGKGKHIDFAKLSRLFQEDGGMRYAKPQAQEEKPNLNSGSTDLAQKIKIMETVSPKRFLSILQNGTKPALVDLRLVDDISKNFHLPNCVINALIDYTLSMNDNVLSRSYCEKVAASLAREGVKTTIDAMTYLKNAGRKSTKGSKKNKYQKGAEEVVTSLPEEENKEEISWDEILDDPDEGDPNGKA